MKKRLLSLLLAALMVVCMFAGCGNSSSGQSGTGNGAGTNSGTQATSGNNESSDASAAGDIKVGYNYFGSGSYALLSLANNSKYAIEAIGDTAQGVDDNFSVEAMVSDIENMINAGCNGVIVWLPADALYLTVADICADHKVPFVLNDKIPSDSAILDELRQNPYFVGAVSPANDVYGTSIAEYALSQGYQTCIVSTAAVGDPSDTPRLEAFQAAFTAGGGTILDILHADSSDGAPQQIEDALVANPNPDFIYGTGSDYGTAAVTALANAGNTTAAVLTSGLDSQVLEYEADGKIQMVNGDYWVAGYFSAVLLLNYLHGNPIKDASGNVPVIDDIEPFVVPTEALDIYKKCFIDEYCYSAEETQAMIGLSYDQFIQTVGEYSLENRVQAKYTAGKVTADEVTAAGFTVS